MEQLQSRISATRSTSASKRTALQWQPPWIRTRSEESCAIRNLLVRPDQHHRAPPVGEPDGQHLGHERPDLARWELDDRGDLTADQVVRAIMLGDLRARFLDTDAEHEVDAELPPVFECVRPGVYSTPPTDPDGHAAKRRTLS